MNLNSPTQRIGLVTAGAALLLVVVWYFALWSPQGHALTKARAAHIAAEAKVSHLRTQIAGLEALEREIPSDTQKLAIYKAAVPDDPELASALDQIQSAATYNHVTLSTIGPSGAPTAGKGSAPQALNGVPIISIALSASGSYPSLMSFLTSLNQMPRTLVVTNMSLSNGSANPGASLTASISSDVFYNGQPTH